MSRVCECQQKNGTGKTLEFFKDRSLTIIDNNNPKYAKTDTIHGLGGTECTKCKRIFLVGVSWRALAYHIFPDDECPEVKDEALMRTYCNMVEVTPKWSGGAYFDAFCLIRDGNSPLFNKPKEPEFDIVETPELTPLVQCVRCNNTDTRPFDRTNIVFPMPSGGVNTMLYKNTVCPCGKVSINENSVIQLTGLLKAMPEFEGSSDKHLEFTARIILSLKN